jgi:hypothetical protein
MIAHPGDLSNGRGVRDGLCNTVVLTTRCVPTKASMVDDLASWCIIKREPIGEGNMDRDEKTTRRPQHLSDYAKVCLRTLVARGLGRSISLGGALGLLHYLDYRSTHDVDAWWETTTTADEQQQVVEALQETLRAFGVVKMRAWGDVTSIELSQEGRTVFSFQIASRSAQLAPSRPAPWINILLDSFDDLVAGKMSALVERGAPRDFRDVYQICQSALTTPAECWELWQRRQELAKSDPDRARARLAIETHLARIAQHRPLEQIASPEERAEAQKLRYWFVEVFLRV